MPKAKQVSTTPAQFAAAMRTISSDSDQEGRHGDADELMCRVLESLGYSEGVTIFREMNKWYA
jgi:hypothetical protein